MQSLASRFVEESSLELHSFLTNSIAEALEPRLRDLDAYDGLGPDRNGKVPPHCSGVDAKNPDIVSADDATWSYFATNSTPTTPLPLGGTLSVNGIIPPAPAASATPAEPKPPSAWTLKGPPHKWRYCTLLPPSPSAPAVSITPISAHPNPSEILRKLQDELFPSQAFRAWLAIVSRLLPIRHFVEARRFRPGLDYTLATSEEKEARLDVVLGLTPEVKDDESDEHETYPQRGWSAAEWGGWEVCFPSHNSLEITLVSDTFVYSVTWHLIMKKMILQSTVLVLTKNQMFSGTTPRRSQITIPVVAPSMVPKITR